MLKKMCGDTRLVPGTHIDHTIGWVYGQVQQVKRELSDTQDEVQHKNQRIDELQQALTSSRTELSSKIEEVCGKCYLLGLDGKTAHAR